MPNTCNYTLMVRAKNKEAIKRLFDIMTYNDKEFYLYRVFEFEHDEDYDNYDKIEPTDIGTFYNDRYYGSVAWATDAWIFDKDDPTDISKKCGAHHSNLLTICKALDIGVEIWSECIESTFQQHIIVDHNGDFFIQTKDWYGNYDDEKDGFGDRFNDFEEKATYVYTLEEDLKCKLEDFKEEEQINPDDIKVVEINTLEDFKKHFNVAKDDNGICLQKVST